MPRPTPPMPPFAAVSSPMPLADAIFLTSFAYRARRPRPAALHGVSDARENAPSGNVQKGSGAAALGHRAMRKAGWGEGAGSVALRQSAMLAGGTRHVN